MDFIFFFFFFQAEDGIRDGHVTGVQTCALPIWLHQARVEIRRNGWGVLCEGNFDLVALHQAGFRNAVAPLGTAFTEQQARLLRRFAQRVTLLFDGASGIVEYLIDDAASRAGPSAADRAAAIAGLGPVLAAVGNPVEIE